MNEYKCYVCGNTVFFEEKIIGIAQCEDCFNEEMYDHWLSDKDEFSTYFYGVPISRHLDSCSLKAYYDSDADYTEVVIRTMDKLGYPIEESCI